MDDRVVVLQAVLLSLAATWWIPSSLRRKGQKRNLELVSWFIGFTMFGVLTNVDRFPVPELLLRSILLGLVPIVGGYLFYRLSTGQKKDN